MKRQELTEAQFQVMMAERLEAFDESCDDILNLLARVAIGGGLPEKEATKRYKKGMDILEKAIGDAGDCIVEHTCGL
jgi:hypothetical protein